MLTAAFIVGVSVAVSPGPVFIAGSQTALTKGFWRAVQFYLGVLAADVLYALLVYFGITTFAESTWFKLILWGLGGTWLIYLGYGAIRTKINLESVHSLGESSAWWPLFRKGFLLTLFNPLTIVGWLALAGNFFTTIWLPNWPPVSDFGLLALIAMLTGVQAWAVGMAGVVSLLRTYINPRMLYWFSVASGVFLIGYGLNAWRLALGVLLGWE
jgi:threonine/homoserine/homoserine lactone efflux protein